MTSDGETSFLKANVASEQTWPVLDLLSLKDRLIEYDSLPCPIIRRMDLPTT